jgi:hypothetical protein
MALIAHLGNFKTDSKYTRILARQDLIKISLLA